MKTDRLSQRTKSNSEEYRGLANEARLALRVGNFNDAHEIAERLCRLRPASEWARSLLTVSQVAVGTKSISLEKVVPSPQLSKLAKLSLRSIISSESASTSVGREDQRRLLLETWARFDNTAAPVNGIEKHLTLDADEVSRTHVKLASSVTAPLSSSLDELGSADWSQFPFAELASAIDAVPFSVLCKFISHKQRQSMAKRFCRLAINEGNPIVAAKVAEALASLGWSHIRLAGAICRDLLASGFIERARRFAANAPACEHGRLLLGARLLVATGDYDAATKMVQDIPQQYRVTLDVAFEMFRALRAQRQYERAIEFGLEAIESSRGAEPKLSFDVALCAGMVPNRLDDLAVILSKALIYADSLIGTAAEITQWGNLYKFRLRCFDIVEATALLSRISSVSNDHSVQVASNHLLALREAFGAMAPLLEKTAESIRRFARVDGATLDEPQGAPEIMIYYPAGWLLSDPRCTEGIPDVRCALYEIIKTVFELGYRVQIVPQIGANESVLLREAPSYIRVAYHTVTRFPGVLNIKEADLPYLAYFDSTGYSGWSALANATSVFRLTRHVSDSDIEDYFEREKAEVIGRNVSKYDQPPIAEDTEFGRYVFVALQTYVDNVQKLAYVPMLTMLDWVVARFKPTAIKVVVKRHPKCRSPLVAQKLRELTENGDVIQVSASIHQLVRYAMAVFTVNSSVGGEALLHLKPVYLFGHADYRHACHEVRALSDFIEKTTPIRLPVSPLRIKRFIYYMRNLYLVNVADAKRLKAAISEKVIGPLQQKRAS